MPLFLFGVEKSTGIGFVELVFHFQKYTKKKREEIFISFSFPPYSHKPNRRTSYDSRNKTHLLSSQYRTQSNLHCRTDTTSGRTTSYWELQKKTEAETWLENLMRNS